MIKRILLDMDGVIADFMTPSVLAHKDAAARKLAIHCAKDMEDNYPRGDKPAMALIQELMQRNDLGYIQVQKGDFSLMLQKHTA